MPFFISANGSRIQFIVLAILCAIGCCSRVSAQTLGWSTYVGGNEYDLLQDLTVDSAGNVFATGVTRSSLWISGGYDTMVNDSGTTVGPTDAFVVKISSSGQHVWSTYLGGEAAEEAYAITTDGAGNCYVAGNTESDGWISGGYDTSRGSVDAFVVKLSPTGSHVWSTYIGEAAEEKAYGIDADPNGDNVYVTGSTRSAVNWVSGGYDATFNGAADGFLVKLSSAGTHVWSTFMGGSLVEIPQSLSVDPSGNILVGGMTTSEGWVSGGFDTSFNGVSPKLNSFVVKVSDQGAHVWSTYVGVGEDFETVFPSCSVATDASGNVYISGETDEAGWVVGGYDTTYGGGTDGFVAKLTSTGSFAWSTYIGGSGGESAPALAIGPFNDVYVVGGTSSIGWASNTFHNFNDSDDAFVLKLSNSGILLWSFNIGGSNIDFGKALATSNAGDIYVGGGTNSTAWISGGYDTTFNVTSTEIDGFVLKIADYVSAVPPETWRLYED